MAELESEYFENITESINFLRHSPEWTFTLAAAYALIFVIGLVGNLMVILVFIQREQIRSVTNTFITNLAVADLFVIVFCVPATLLSNIFIPWILGSFLCKWVAYVQGVSVCLSSYSLVAIAFDRCKAICRPMERANGLSRTETYLLILVIWVMSLFLNIPSAFVFETIETDPYDTTFCVEIWNNELHGKIYFLIVNLLSFYVNPFLLMFLMYLKIWISVATRHTPPAANSSIQTVHRNTRYSVLKMILVVTLSFLLCWLPLFVLATMVKLSWIDDSMENVVNTYLPISQLMGFSNSGINPILYAFLNSKFRRHFTFMIRACLPGFQKLPESKSMRRQTQRRVHQRDSQSTIESIPTEVDKSGRKFPFWSGASTKRNTRRVEETGAAKSPKIAFIEVEQLEVAKG